MQFYIRAGETWLGPGAEDPVKLNPIFFGQRGQAQWNNLPERIEEIDFKQTWGRREESKKERKKERKKEKKIDR